MHIRKEYKDLKNNFKEWYSWKFDKQVSQYIVEYKRINQEIDNDTKSINDIAETLIIDIGFSLLSPFNKKIVNTNTFITSFNIIYFTKKW